MIESQLAIDFAAARAARDRGMQQAIDPKVHCLMNSLWKSLVYPGASA